MNNKNLLSGRDKELQQLAEQYEAARKEKKALYLDADDLADLADWYSVKRKYDKAIEVADYGLKLHPDNSALIIEKAYIYIDDGKKEMARQTIAELRDHYSPESKIIRAHLLLDEEKVDEAEDILKSIENKEDLTNMVDVAYMYIDLGLPEKALQWIEPGLTQYSDDEAYIAVMADCFYCKGLYDEASGLYNKLIDINPYSAPYWSGLAKCHFDQGAFDKSIEACDYALIGDDEFADAYILKGHSFQQLGNDKESIECFQRAQELKGVSLEFLYAYIGFCKLNESAWGEAFENFEKAIKLNEENNDETVLSDLYLNAALCLAKLGKKRASHQYCKKAHILHPENPEPFLIEGRVYLEERNKEKAFNCWEKALRIAPLPDTWHEIGMHSLEMGAYDSAKHAFEKVCQLDPDYEGIYERLTILYMMLQDKKNFKKYNQKCSRPFNLSELEKLMKELNKNDQQDLASCMQKIIKALK